MRTALALAAATMLASVAILALWWTPYPVDGVAIQNRLADPSLAHPLGTDQYGRDVLSMLMAGARTSLGVAAGAVLVGVAAGAPLGLIAASAGRRLDALVMRGADLVFAFPALIVAVILTTLTGPGAGVIVTAVGIFNVPVFTRLTAGAARRVMALDFVDAARLAGKSRARIAVEHVAPNVAPVVLTQAATQFAVAILAEAGLSYVGLGAQPPTVSWGRMLNEAQTLVALAPGLAVWPGLAIVVSVLSVTTLAEALRLRFDPRFASAAA